MRPTIFIATLWLALSCHVPAIAQKATEQFIPLGASPGVSGDATDIGRIAKVDRAARRIVLDPAAGGRSVRITKRTRIWVDKSKYRLATLAGSFDDLRVGRMAEVKYQRTRDQGLAEWIKVVPEGPE